jgi:predicted dienelactone hydrolase
MSSARTIALATLALTASCAIATSRPPAGSESAIWLAPGPHRVRTRDVVFRDRAHDRRLASTIWWPADAAGPLPLVVQAHGFLANRNALGYVARHLASRGYVVVAATHPTTTAFAPGGAKVQDVLRQPADVRFLIDRMLASDTGIVALPRIDPRRIAVMGHSLGGLTATLAAFHPRLRDPRITAAISIAGPMAMLGPRMFRGADVAFLMIGGSADVIVDYRRNALGTLARVPDATLATIAAASHAGFHQATARLPFPGNPDVVGCWLLRRTLHLDAALAETRPQLRGDDDIDIDEIRPPCTEPPPRNAMRPARQQMLTTLLVAAFLESRFAAAPADRAHAWTYLTTTLPRELPEIAVATSAEAPAAGPAPDPAAPAPHAARREWAEPEIPARVVE